MTAAIWGVMVTLVGVPVYNAYRMFGVRSVTKGGRSWTPFPISGDYPVFASRRGSEPKSRAQLYVLIDRFDPATLTTGVELWLVLPSNVVALFADPATHQPLMRWNWQKPALTQPQDANLTLTMASFAWANPASKVRELVVPLSRFRGYMDGAVVANVGEVQLQMLGVPTAYPLDDYQVELHTDLALTGNAEYGRGGNGIGRTVPLNMRIGMAPSLSGMAASVDFSSGDSSSGTDVFVQLRRDTRLLRTVWVVIVSITLLLLVAAVALKRQVLGTTDLWAAITGLAGLALAVLPLRSVLVPAELPTQTLLDAVLTAYITCVIALMLHTIGRKHPPL